MTENHPPSMPDRGIDQPEASPDSFARVEDILKYNLERQKEHEKPIEVIDKKSRKLRDYLICMIFVNALLVLPNFLTGLNVVVMVYSFSGIVIFSSGFTWVMWTVIGDY